MNGKKMPTEDELLKGLDEHTSHADELAQPMPEELEPLARLKGSVERYDKPFESVWDSSDGDTESDLDEGARIGFVALKGFFGICEQWQCSREQMRLLLGGISEDEIDHYRRLPHQPLPQDVLLRVSYLLGIYSALQTIFSGDKNRVSKNLRRPQDGEPFNGASPLDFMVDSKGATENLKSARKFFDAYVWN